MITPAYSSSCYLFPIYFQFQWIYIIANLLRSPSCTIVIMPRFAILPAPFPLSALYFHLLRVRVDHFYSSSTINHWPRRVLYDVIALVAWDHTCRSPGPSWSASFVLISLVIGSNEKKNYRMKKKIGIQWKINGN